MKPLCLAVVLSVGMLGCQRHETVVRPDGIQVVKPEKALTDEEKIGLLRAEAHKRGLKWHVYCVDRPWKFQAEAHEASEPSWATYIEDGRKDYWIEVGNTQAEAAYALFIGIQGQAGFHPDHRPGTRVGEKLCPPELRGE